MTRRGVPSSSTCRRCGAQIRWVQSSNGRAMPIDPLPVPNGNLRLVPRHHWTEAVRVSDDYPARPTEDLYVHHAASCAAPSPRRKRA